MALINKMKIRNFQLIKYRLGNVIPVDKNRKCLGIIFSNNLNWGDHIHSVARK